MDTCHRLRRAIQKNKVETVKLIIEHHPELLVNYDASNGWTNLHYAASCGCYDVCVYLISSGHDQKEVGLCHDRGTALHLAAAANQEKALHYLAQHMQRSIDWRNSRGETALMVATKKGNDPCVNLLIDFGANVDIADDTGSRPIHVAASFGHVKTLRTLVDRGADCITPNNEGWTPIDYSSTFKVHAYFHSLMLEAVPLRVPAQIEPSTPVKDSFQFSPRGSRVHPEEQVSPIAPSTASR